MQFYKMYSQENKAEIEAFIHSQPYCYLITSPKVGVPQLGVFNHVFDGKYFHLHLNKNDEQVKDLEQNNKALISLHRYLATIPSYWLDPHYAGAATAYYKYVEFECEAEIFHEVNDKHDALKKILAHYQPEGGYDSLEPQSNIYKGSTAIVLVRFNPIAMRSKWKFGQAKSLEVQEKLAEKLKLRGTHLDIEAANEIVKMNMNHEIGVEKNDN